MVRQLGEGFCALVVMTAVLVVQWFMVHKLKAGTIMEDDTSRLGKVRAALLQAFQVMEAKDVYLPSDALVLLLTAALESGIDLADLTNDQPEDDEYSLIPTIRKLRHVD